MKPKKIIKITVDILMTLTIFILMGYHLWGYSVHKWVGIGAFVLFIVHNLLNLRWYKNLFKGKYTPIRVFITAVNFIVLLCMLALMYSGAVMAGIINTNLALARKLHLLGAYWGYLFICIHLGLHFNMILSAVRKVANIKEKSKIGIWALFSVTLTTVIYGVAVLIKRDFPAYLFLHSEFVFMDYEESKLLFYADYVALMVLCIFVSHSLCKLFVKNKHTKQKKKS